MNSRAAGHASSLLADGVDFIEDDDVQTTVSTKLVRKKLDYRSLFEYIINHKGETMLSVD